MTGWSAAPLQKSRKVRPQERWYRGAVVTWVNGSLVLATTVCGLVGWKFGAAGAQAPATPATLQVNVSALSSLGYAQPANMTIIYQSLPATDDDGRLGVLVSGDYPAKTLFDWIV